MEERGMIKWAPFDSVISNKYIINSLVKEKEKILMPTLSSDELDEIEQNIINAYYTHSLIKISYYKDGYIFNIIDKIKKIDKTNKLIYLNNIHLIFSQILDIKFM